MNKNLKIFIVSMLAVTIVFSVLFDEFLWELLLVALVSAKKLIAKLLIISKKFFFKEGIVSFATIAWKHVFVTSFIALSKRAVINSIVEFFHQHVAEPLVHPVSRYIKIRWKIFKTSNLWKKTYTLIFSIIPATLLLWIVGILEAIMMLLHSFSLAKFLTVILKLITMTFLFFQNLWRTWVQPYIDYILITILLSYLERIPVVGRFLRRVRILIRWNWRKLRSKRAKIIDHHVDRNVHLFGERIHQHVNKKKEVMKEQLKTLEEAIEEITQSDETEEKTTDNKLSTNRKKKTAEKIKTSSTNTNDKAGDR